MANQVRRWDTLGAIPFDYAEPVRPAEVVNVRSMWSVPLLVGALLAASAAVGLTVAVLTSVRAVPARAAARITPADALRTE